MALSRDEIRAAVRVFADEVPSTATVHLIIVGGAAMALAFDARQATKDVDVIVIDGDRDALLAAAKRVAAARGLPSDWLNDAAARFASHASVGREVFASANLAVHAASVDTLPAMKLAAWRGTSSTSRTRASSCPSSRPPTARGCGRRSVPSSRLTATFRVRLR